MQEVFENIIERLERLKTPCELGMIENGRYILRDKAVEIVKQEAEKCKSIYMDGEYCWQSCWCTDRCGECNRLCNGDIDYYESYDAKNNLWISCNERLPEPIRPVLVTLRNWMNDKYFVRVGRFHTDHWKTDEGIVENSVVVAWQPLPEPYHPKFIQECANPVSQEEREELNKNIRNIPIGTYQTNADRIRAMSDEELAMNMMCPNEKCDKSDNCNCYACILKWLQSEAEE